MNKKYQVKIMNHTISLSIAMDQLGEVNPEMETNELKDRLNRLPLSADLKAMLWSLKDHVLRIGDQLWKIGQKVLELVVKATERFPYASTALVAGLIIKALLASIPLVGWLLGPSLGAILVVVMLAAGTAADLRAGAAKLHLDDTIEAFRHTVNRFCHQ